MPMTENQGRANRAKTALAFYEANPMVEPSKAELDDSTLVDFLADAMHLVGARAFEEALSLAMIHHSAEVEEGDDSDE